MIHLSEQTYILFSNLVFGYSEWAKKQPKGHEVEPNDDPGTYFSTDEAQKILKELLPASPHPKEEGQKVRTMVEWVREYFRTTPIEQVQKEWAEVEKLFADAPKEDGQKEEGIDFFTSLTPDEKLRALDYRFYQGGVWEPKIHDYYTTSRADLELYRIHDVTDDKIITRYCGKPETTEWDKTGFLTDGFGPRRVWVPNWIFDLRKQEQKEYVEDLKQLLRLAHCPEILIENPGIVLHPAKPTPEDIEWAEGCIKRYEQSPITEETKEEINSKNENI